MDKKFKFVNLKLQNVQAKKKKLIIIKKKDLKKYIPTTTERAAICVGQPKASEKFPGGDLRNIEGHSTTGRTIQIKNQSTNSKLNKDVIETLNGSGNFVEIFNCQLCSEEFNDQLEFFLHLKFHYEPSRGIAEEKNSDVLKIGFTNRSRQKSNVHCIQCNKTFKSRRAYDCHIRDVHIKVEVNEFSDHEGIMNGMETGEPNSGYWVDET